MTRKQLIEKITEFYEQLKAYRKLLSGSRDSMVQIVRNHEEIAAERSDLNRKYGSLERYIKKFGNYPMRSDVGGGPYPVYEVGLSTDILQRRGPCIDATIQDLEFILGRLENMTNENFEEKRNPKEITNNKMSPSNSVIFPEFLMKKMPQDIAVLCDEFNFNYQNRKPHAGMLLLRRILPLSIVRKFQQLSRESEIKDDRGEFFDTKALLGKVECILKNKRIYKEIMSYKTLVDSSQHSYSLNIDITDTEGTAVKIRVFLDDIF